MQDNQNFLINADKQDVLFSELDCNVNFDEIVQKSYELHPTNVFLEQSSPMFDLDSCLESKVKPLEIGNDLKVSNQALSRMHKVDMICKDSIDCNQSYIYKDNNSSIFVGCKEGFMANSKKDKESSINCLNLTQQCITNTKISIYNCSFQRLQSDKDKIKEKLSKHSKRNSSQKKTKHTLKFKRWGHKEDIETFKLLRLSLKDKGIEDETFFNHNIDEILKHSSQTIIAPLYKSITEQLLIDLNWLRTPYHLLHRMFKLTQNQDFSFRENYLLNKVVYSISSLKQDNFEELAELFPGKLVSTIKEKVKCLQS